MINTLATTFSQALSQTLGKGKGAGQQHNDNKGKGKSGEQKDYSKVKCWTCGGLHLAKLWKKGPCPNEVAEANGTAAQNKQKGVHCTYWVDKQKTPCGGTHSWEDHRAALQKFVPPKGKGSPSGKGGKAKGKGKSKDKSHAFVEGQSDDQVAEDPVFEFLQASNWWSGESLEALTDVRRSGSTSSPNYKIGRASCRERV